MTLNEYRNKIYKEIAEAGSAEEAKAIVEKAHRVLEGANLSEDSKGRFWVKLYDDFGGALEIATESQGADALSDIIRAAKSVIAQKAQAVRGRT